MLASGDVALVRDILGVYGAGMEDSALMNDSALAISWRTVLMHYPDAATATDPDALDTIDRAQALFHAANALEAQPALSSSKLGDQSMSFESGSMARLVESWRRRAISLLTDLMPAAQPLGSGLFRVGTGKRGS